MARKFRTPDYEATLKQTIILEEALPPNHLARFVVDIVTQLDLSVIYARYAPVGGEAIAPEILLALLFYAYANGVFSSRKIEKATYESIPFRFVAGGLHPDHDTLAHFRKTFLAEIQELFVQILLLAKLAGVLKLGNISLDGSKIHADASKHHAVSYKRLGELEAQLRQEVQEVLALGEQADQGGLPLPEGVDLKREIALRQERLVKLAEARGVLEARARERYAAEQAKYEAKRREREEKARQGGRKPRGRPPQPPQPGPNDQQQMEPTLATLAPEGGKPEAAALDNGYFSQANVQACERRGIEPYIATGREPHHKSWQSFFEERPEPPSEEASLKVKMAYKLQTEIGQAIYRLRKCTVEPVIGLMKEVLGFRQFSLRGLRAAASEWCLVCLAFNLKRLHVLLDA